MDGEVNITQLARLLQPAFDSERLDEMHNAVTRYFGNKLGPAPLDGLHPSKTMELGCGSGAWAIQAAKQFPDAEVVAIDRHPLPDRSLPPNITFQLADLAQKLDFEDQMFDIVHARWVMVHVTRGRGKPGGLLLIEDGDFVSIAESGGPATRGILHKFNEIQKGLGVDVELGRKIESILMSLGDFSDIHMRKVSAPFGANGPDEALNQLGLGIKKSIREFYKTLSQRMHDQGLTPELLRGFEEELELDDNPCVVDLYFCWARRSMA
ncbi:S-adenosyl-L-methionine-dependent methyltransferase [Mycena sanguinolenta]|uniref:S-adenosyl-L-methionine-dependent methyltransferase n=1 Tax=Mycena sanguinolenta TaxID=230812 RepID=A0A8H6ZCG0_9AGAR|nr:S-adenosyl-L-methionine-dependent methyltransferase [Mycena sanguinolenta]